MSSHRRHHQGSGSSPLKTSGRDGGHSRTRDQDGPLAGGPRMTLADRSRARTGRSVLPAATLRDNSNTQPSGSMLPSENFRDDTKFKTSYTKPEDVKMAEKQRKYTSLPPEEQKEQDKWAHDKLKTHLSACPEGYSWTPWKQKGFEGYRCQGGAHLVTHELLAEGQEGLYSLNLWPDSNFGSKPVSMSESMIWTHDVAWMGPLYPGRSGGRHNAAYPGGPPDPMLARRRNGGGGNARQSYRGMAPDLRMMGGTGSGPMGCILPSANFRDDTGIPHQQIVPPTSANPPSAPDEYYGGRTMPKGWTPDQHRQAPSIPVDPGWPRPPRDFTQDCLDPKLLVMPPEAVNNPNYRGNYRTITSDYDKAMAERQLRFNTLSPAEQAVQKKWAKAHLMRTGVCGEGFGWWSYKTDERAPGGAKLEGYRCWAGGHIVTHELLVEDKGRYYTPGIDEDWNDKWAGPVWPRLHKPPRGMGGIVTLADERGEPKWKDPNWRYGFWAPPGSRPEKKKWWKR